MIDAETLAEWKTVAEAATPGPWTVWDRGIGFEVHWHGDHRDGEGPFEVSLFDDSVAGRPDAAHIATFDPPTVLALIAEVGRLNGALTNAGAVASDWIADRDEITRDVMAQRDEARAEIERLRKVIAFSPTLLARGGDQ